MTVTLNNKVKLIQLFGNVSENVTGFRGGQKPLPFAVIGESFMEAKVLELGLEESIGFRLVLSNRNRM